MPHGFKSALQQAGIHGIIGVFGKKTQKRATAILRLQFGKCPHLLS